MSIWTPEWKLTVDGIDYSDKTIASVTHYAGRKSIYEQPVASYLQVEIVDLNHTTYDFDVNDQISLEVKDSNGDYVKIFGGNITDVQTQVKNAGRVTAVVSYTIIALGALAKLTRNVTNGVLSRNYDGEQIYTLLQELLFDTWSEVPIALTWDTYEPTTTWANAQNSGVGEVDRPGDYELHARASSPITTYSLVTALANSGLGYVYENAEGQICYADSTHRSQFLSANGYVDVSANNAIAPGLATLARASDVRNDITVTYKNAAQVTAKDTGSMSTYGTLASVISTSLEHTADATSQAAFYLALRAYPQALLNNITFELANPEIDDSDRDALLNVFMGLALNIQDLPEALGSEYQGFIEGWSFKTGYNSLSLTLNLSPIAYSLQAFRWNSVPATEYWNTLNPTLDWLNATIVA